MAAKAIVLSYALVAGRHERRILPQPSSGKSARHAAERIVISSDADSVFRSSDSADEVFVARSQLEVRLACRWLPSLNGCGPLFRGSAPEVADIAFHAECRHSNVFVPSALQGDTQ